MESCFQEKYHVRGCKHVSSSLLPSGKPYAAPIHVVSCDNMSCAGSRGKDKSLVLPEVLVHWEITRCGGYLASFVPKQLVGR